MVHQARLFECLQSRRGPIQLIRCSIDNRVLANALTGNSRVTKLEPAVHRDTTADDARVPALFPALASNRGLLDLNFRSHPIDGENWTILCESLKAHPSLTSLDLRDTRPLSLTGTRIMLSDEQKTHRTCVLAEMVKHNTVLQTIHLRETERDEQIYAELILPHLETNRYRPRVLAVKKTTERPYHEKVLGRALHCVRSNPTLVWMFLSQNVDAFVRSEEESNTEVTAVAGEEVVTVIVAGGKRKR
jgi:hypothetical protein